MAYHISIPKKIIFDTNLRDVDLRLYAIIAHHTNETGYSEISNQKLMQLSGKKKRTLNESLHCLQERGYIVIVHNAKSDDIYPDNIPRVIWLEEAYSSMVRKRKKTKEKTKQNDFRVFVKWLKEDCRGMPFPVDHGGLVTEYVIHDDRYMYRHEKGEEPTLIDSNDSWEIYKIMFRKRSVIFERLQDVGESNVVTKYAQTLAQEKKEI